LALYSPSQLELNFWADVARRTKASEDKARIEREKTSYGGLLEIARANGNHVLFLAVHKTLSPCFFKAGPFRGALAFYTGAGKSAIRAFPGPEERPGRVGFTVDPAVLTAAIAEIYPVDRETVISAMPRLRPGPGTRWQSGVFTRSVEVVKLARLFADAAERSHQAALKAAGDRDSAEGTY
jgi:hypothetical protein